MNWRKILLALLALLALGVTPLAEAQQAGKVYRIGILSQTFPRGSFALFFLGLRNLGYEEGRNIVFDFRYAEGREDRLPGLAADMVASKVDLIVAPLNTDILAAKRATSTIPIVMLYAMAPVESKLVASLAHPGGNVTGTTISAPETAGKMLEVLHDAVPHATRITILWEPEFPGMELYRRETEHAAEALGIRLTLLPVRTLVELETAFTVIVRNRPDALYVVPTGALSTHRARVIEFAARQRLPAMYTGSKTLVVEGGLISYTPDVSALMPRAVAITDRILKGAKPADLPVEQPTKFALVINLKTAKALGLTIPQSLLLRADEVIE
jgi:putative ABC transport system substrate-binding protein